MLYRNDGAPPGEHPVEDNGLDLSGLFRFLRRRWRVIVGTAIVIGALAALALMQATPRYTAAAAVAVQSQKQQVVAIKDVMSDLSPDAATMETQAQILRSNRLAGLLIDRLHLEKDPEFNPALAPGAPAIAPPELRARLIANVLGAIQVATVPRSFVLEITATSADANKAALIANTLAALYISDGTDAKYAATRRASLYLRDRVEELRGQAVAADQAAERYRASAGLVGSDTGATVASQQMSELNSQLVTARAERAAKEAQLGQIRALAEGGADGGIEASAAILASPLIQRLREQESEVLRKLAELQTTYGERHPRILNANAELRDLRGKIAEEIRKVAVSAANDVKVAQAREATLQASLARLERAVSAGGQASVRLRELQRESEASRAVYEVFLNRQKETNQQAALQTADARIVSQAEVPLTPSFPRVGLTLGAALGFGLLAGLAVAGGVERMDATVRSADALEAMGGGAVMALLPEVADGRPEDSLIARPDSYLAEALRTLNTALALSDRYEMPRVVLLSSAVSGEGKTFTSVGLARVSAQMGARTLLIDADMRRARVHEALGMENATGLAQVLAGEVQLDAALLHDEATGLFVLPAGRHPGDPPGLLRSEAMADLIARVRGEYDMVVVDAPPFAPLPDGQLLAGLADKLVFVVQWGATPAAVVRGALRVVERSGAPLAGTVLTRVDLRRYAQYGHVAAYHYGV